MMATLAPVVVSGVLWVVTRSPYAIMFAVLGPAIAVAAMADGWRATRRDRRRSAVEHAAAMGRLEQRIIAAHDQERALAWQRHPSALDAFLSPAEDPRRWSARTVGSVVIGTGPVPASADLLGETEVPGDEPTSIERARMATAASVVEQMPVLASVRGGVGIVAPAVLARSMLRGLVLQVADAVPADALRIIAPSEPGWEWMARLPHAVSNAEAVLQVTGPGEQPVADASVLAWATSIAKLAGVCESVVAVPDAVSGRVLRGTGHGTAVLVELVSSEQALAHARKLAGLAPAAAGSPIPESLACTALTPAPRRGLAAVVGLGHRGPVEIDLVADGPHAVVGGTTGSGKSELVVTWLAAMAASHPVSEFTFLLVDFKGGATGIELTGLPHCLGVVSDLDGRAAERAVASLRAELSRRERVLATARARSIDEIYAESRDAFPRLVVVVDEFAALLGATPELGEVFTDIAARGRSLGIHLILCTQRPAGVVREALMANCAIRISLRVNDAADSSAVVGTPEAAAIPVNLPGRCILSSAAGTAEMQVATTDAADIARIAESADVREAPHRPWLEPLPLRLDPRHPRLTEACAKHPGEGAVLGMIDRPTAQEQPVVRWSPASDGNLLIAGSAGSGLTTMLEVVAMQAPHARRPAPEPEALWDALVSAETDGGLLLIDDWDAVCAHWGLEHRQAATERLGRLLRSRGGVVLATRRPAQLGGIATLFGRTVVLHCDDRSDHQQLGAPVALWERERVPGRGVWQGESFQGVVVEGGAALDRAVIEDVPAGGPLLVVTGAGAVGIPTEDARELIRLETVSAGGLRMPGQTSGVLAADAESWQRAGSIFDSLRRTAPVVFDGCSLGEFRMLARGQMLPPALAGSSVWLVRPGESAVRARWR